MQTIIKTFEKSKREAGAIIDEKHDADRRKSENLKTVRLSRDRLPAKPPE